MSSKKKPMKPLRFCTNNHRHENTHSPNPFHAAPSRDQNRAGSLIDFDRGFDNLWRDLPAVAHNPSLNMNQETKEPDLIEQLIAYSVWMEESKEEREEFKNARKGGDSSKD